MALTVNGVQRFGTAVIHLHSFPLFTAYIIMVIGANVWQKLTKPMSLRLLLIMYNAVCVILSSYTVLGLSTELAHSGNLFQKEPVSSLQPYLYTYWLTKNIELLDTVFMVLRHRRRQISFLHVYHHATMLLLSDYAYHLTPWPAIAVFLFINSMVHILLYSYYCLTALQPHTTPRWKQRLTELQIVQFFIDFLFAGVGYLHHGFCVYGLLYGVFMTALFANFYYHAYLKKGHSVKKIQ